MNIQKAYIGALRGLDPTAYNSHIRRLQVAFAIQLARLRQRGDAEDGHYVTQTDLCMLKERGEVRLK